MEWYERQGGAADPFATGASRVVMLAESPRLEVILDSGVCRTIEIIFGRNPNIMTTLVAGNAAGDFASGDVVVGSAACGPQHAELVARLERLPVTRAGCCSSA